MPYVKLDTGILDSTLWSDRDERDLFITALLMAVPHELQQPAIALDVHTAEPLGWSVPAGWYGIVKAAGVGIVRRCGMEQAYGLEALARLGAPDPESRTPDHEGRRIVRVKGGFIVLNFMQYRDRDDTAAERQRRYRERKKNKPSDAVTDNGNAVTHPNITQAVSSKQEAVSSKQEEEEEAAAAATASRRDAVDPVFEALTAVPSPHGVAAYLKYLELSRVPAAVQGELRMVAEGVRGVKPSWAEIGDALHEAQVAGAPFTSRVLLGFLRGGKKPTLIGADTVRTAIDLEIAAGKRGEVF